ncbi:hypothetical protein [Armatimonas rosea]|uniref:Uncharacterized protein n=1 Tax=Armatimonas rosea TaxID=685828 RepID=A0A7W9SV75_ARMRO|nr:hypothetical protein [Armatimonas rosea]MBB6053286.1 hypothetical protein [Armatimonas rosea]
MSKLLSLLPQAQVFEETRAFIDSRYPDSPETLAFRIVPGPLHDIAVQDKKNELQQRFVTAGEVISLPGQPPQTISSSMCKTLALLLVCQCPPKADQTVSGGVTEDLTGLGWKPYTLDTWVEIANGSPQVFWASVALVRLLEARAAGLKTRRSYVSLAYQQEMPEGANEDDLVSPTLDGLMEEGIKTQEALQGNE